MNHRSRDYTRRKIVGEILAILFHEGIESVVRF